MNNWMAVALIIFALFAGFMLGTGFTYMSITTMLNKAFAGSDVSMNIELNETELVNAAMKLMKEDYNFTKDFNELKNMTGVK